MSRLYLLVTFFFTYIDQDGAEKTLKMANVVYRHGARAPRAFYPNDPYQEKFWPDGAGRLTQYGMRLEYDLGKFFKERYIINNTLVSEQYLHKEVYIQSSDVDRCVQSAEAQLAGLYPPKGYQVWNTEIPWQPVPLHTVPAHEDVMLRALRVPCARLKQMWEEKSESEEYKTKVRETEKLLKIMSKRSGMKLNFDNLYYVTDSVRCEKAEGLKIPNWIGPIWKEAADLEDWLHVFYYSGNDEYGRLLGGALLGKINDNMKKYSENDNDSYLYKLNIWSAHDTSLLSLCAALGFKCHLPEYSASIMIELYHSTQDGYSVEIQYRKDHTNKMVPLKLKGCHYNYPLEKFLRLTAARTTTDRGKLCERKYRIIDSHKGKTLAFLTIGFLFLCAVIGIVICLAKQSPLFRYKLGHCNRIREDTDTLIKCVESREKRFKTIEHKNQLLSGVIL